MNLTNIITVFFTAMVPMVEVKGAIPIGVAMGMTAIQAMIVAYIGSIIPIPFIILFLRKILDWMKKTKIFNKIATWIENKIIKKAQKVNHKYLPTGLFIFASLSLPGTGVWMASGIATLAGLRLKEAILPICLGNIVACLVWALLSHVVL